MTAKSVDGKIRAIIRQILQDDYQLSGEELEARVEELWLKIMNILNIDVLRLLLKMPEKRRKNIIHAIDREG